MSLEGLAVHRSENGSHGLAHYNANWVRRKRPSIVPLTAAILCTHVPLRTGVETLQQATLILAAGGGGGGLSSWVFAGGRREKLSRCYSCLLDQVHLG